MVRPHCGTAGLNATKRNVLLLLKWSVQVRINCQISVLLFRNESKVGQILFSCYPDSESRDVKLVDGPGKCSGRLEVLQEGRWKQVSSIGWKDENSNQVCKRLKCGDKRKEKHKFKMRAGDTVSLRCKNGKSDIFQCDFIPISAGGNQDSVGITCDGEVFFFDVINSPLPFRFCCRHALNVIA